ncbi:MAG TPA: hypothetical protein VFI37_07505 [Gaiellaceae bacterium]|nr:hypothetical protein [Gaiellaceae bacterium]
MRQLITRIDDDLHVRLKARARAEGRSMNAVVQELLERELPPVDPDEDFRRRAEAAGIGIFVPPRPEHVPSWDEVAEDTRGAGRAASEALEADRARR